MRIWERIKLGLRILFGLRFGVIVDQDYAVGGHVSSFNIGDADVGIILYDRNLSVEELVLNRLSGGIVDGTVVMDNKITGGRIGIKIVPSKRRGRKDKDR